MLPAAASDSHAGGRVWLCAHLGAGWGGPPSLRRRTPVSGRSSALLIHGVCYYCSLSKTCLNRGFSKIVVCDVMDLHLFVPSFTKPPLSAPKNNSQRNELETSVGPCSVPMKGSLDGGVCLEGGIWSAFCRAPRLFQDFSLQVWMLRGIQVGACIPLQSCCLQKTITANFPLCEDGGKRQRNGKYGGNSTVTQRKMSSIIIKENSIAQKNNNHQLPAFAAQCLLL